MDEPIIFGVNLSHDTSCAAIVAGEVKVAIAEERLNRVKYCTGLTPFGKLIPFHSIRYCCDYLGIRPEEVDLFVVNSCRSNALANFRHQLLGIDERKSIAVEHPGHHLVHACSAFYCSEFEEAAVMVLDTNGSFIERPGPRGAILERKEHFSCYHGRNTELRPVLKDYVLPGELSIGELYCIYSAALQLTPQPGPYGFDCAFAAGGKLMGLAAHDRGRTPPPDLWSSDTSHISIRLDRLVDHLRNKGFVERDSGADLGRSFGFDLPNRVQFKRRKLSLKRREYIGLAGEAQRLLEEVVLEIARKTHEETDSTSLCLAGGNMLNVVACTRILERTPFERVMVQPAAGDAGNAIGAGMYGYFQHLGGRNRFYLNNRYSTYLGREYSARDIESAISRSAAGWSFTARRLSSREEKVAAILPKLLDGKIVGLFDGRSEFGPRALGNRSFIASPLRRSMRDRMNHLKRRAWYRPVAPIVLESEFQKFFSAPLTKSPFMSFSADCKPVTRRLAPAICHVDGTARPQTVQEEDQPLLHDLLVAFAQRTSVPILINTSFNLEGDPIVETPADAIETFLKGELVEDMLIGDFLLEKRPVQPFSLLAPAASS